MSRPWMPVGWVASVVASAWQLAWAGKFDHVPPLLKRGVLAWTNAASESPRGAGSDPPLRLLAHAVDDGTSDAYVAQVYTFLRRVKMLAIPFESDLDVDFALARELDDRCYIEKEPFSRGSLLFYGILHFFPTLSAKLPLSWRALRTWQKIYPSEEGHAYPEELIYAVILHMARRGQLWEMVWVWLSMDCYLRQQDAEGLMMEDIIAYGTQVVLTIAPRARGARAKTGSDQGVEVDSSLLARILIALRPLCAEGTSFFPRGRGDVGKAFVAALLVLGVVVPRLLHVLRHTGATRDMANGTRDQEATRRRGRWAQIKSVARYAKPYVLVRARAEAPADALLEGQNAMLDFPNSLARAVRGGKSGSSHLARRILGAIEEEQHAAVTGASPEGSPRPVGFPLRRGSKDSRRPSGSRRPPRAD
jgi:hypothetical protein